ncbi:MAG: hypothetical protein KJ548_14650, partial [Actinobacteria bacterium]|nr:hypothetical protein [Actinomycetota bacterium]MBU4392305.1 hypothetical protein [Actinomycetota bacterium]
ATGFRLSGFGLVIRPEPGPASPRTGKSDFAVPEIQLDAMRRGGEREEQVVKSSENSSDGCSTDARYSGRTLSFSRFSISLITKKIIIAISNPRIFRRNPKQKNIT